jgi:RND family efflux transporter MFP subunit
MGRQDVAKREWELLNKGVPHNPLDSELALRKPHLEKAQADLEAARAALQRAELDLARTVVRAPFNCMVRTKNVDLGSRASSQDQLADLVGTDQYLVRASVPVDRLKWIVIPSGGKDQGSKTRIFYGNASGSERKGTVVRLLGDLEEEGRMARILIAVDDPLDLDSPDQTRPPLLIGEYVRLEIEGPELNDVVVLPRAALRDGTYVWVIGDGDTLDIRSVDIAWRGEEAVLVRNELRDGERIIMTGLSAPVQGMKVMVNTPTGETSASRPDKNRKQVADKS